MPCVADTGLQESVCEVVYSTSELLCPGLYLERAPLSVNQLTQRLSTAHGVAAEALSTAHAYTPRDIVLAQLAGTTCLLADSVNEPETLVDLITFGDEQVSQSITQ